MSIRKRVFRSVAFLGLTAVLCITLSVIRRHPTTFDGDFGIIYYVVASPDGTTLAGVGEDRRIHLWDAAGKSLTTLERRTGDGHSVAFSPDGKTWRRPGVRTEW
jgi:WD40 repeat protein